MVYCFEHSNKDGGTQTIHIGQKCQYNGCNKVAKLSEDKKRIIWVKKDEK